MPEVVQYIGAKRNRATAWKAFLQTIGHWQVTGFGQWAIKRRQDQQLIGQTGFFYAARGLGEDFDSFPEAGWVLVPDAHGQGIGREAVEAAHDWYDRHICGPLVAVIVQDNVASIRLAIGLGYKRMRKADPGGDPVVLFRREAPTSGA